MRQKYSSKNLLVMKHGGDNSEIIKKMNIMEYKTWNKNVRKTCNKSKNKKEKEKIKKKCEYKKEQIECVLEGIIIYFNRL